MVKRERIRDPLHDLIEFGEDENDLWKVLNTREFQRLRRVKQLGFSELVYPGATHTRFSHSVGVFHTARQLCRIIKPQTNDYDPDRARVAQAAALVHDLGHGPFSHAFEEALKEIDRENRTKPKKHEIWTSDILLGDTEVGEALGNISTEFRSSVADLLAREIPQDIYHAVVSSQFDADRLDYMRRDRLMTGVQHGGFDFSWLVNNLEVRKIHLATDDQVFDEVDSLVLGKKAFQAAESYVLGLFHLYFTVYFHKATRSAEKMLSGLLKRVARLSAEGRAGACGLSDSHPIVEFLRNRSLSSYLELDDFVIWSALVMVRSGEDHDCNELAGRILDRRLYKAVDVGAHFEGRPQAVVAFKSLFQRAKANGEFGEIEVFEDSATRNPYRRKSEESPEALSKIWIRTPGGDENEDLSTRSSVVRQLEEKKIYRVYARDDGVKGRLEAMLEGV